MKIEILGTGCAKCKALEINAKEAVAKSAKFAQVIKVEDINEILKYDVLSMPALVVNGTVLSSGKVLSVDEIVNLLKNA
ncbi:thioredoxin family protein [Campylobacter geochelonis]|uniref:Redox-active disulfide protein 2 n=1 Tax=Campylobacter geochelonis TaxID=1780362 RepID=A0A128EJI5_9BACT|nr:thioredoxin family protein [Campylobacter geochelonis]QKF71256.1 thioredoxin family protein (Thioredoxin_3 domain) [Campylobacter geochelonis]CZE48164.1 redox-active disulfide protein 2 [Campylobacter geochelonis]CZE49050.1 redox-active disulfide protein 2 [Campylobacter geochelonis]CZE51125.1 redox-active disulfide protein 2 [Campylobacter geochelonis]